MKVTKVTCDVCAKDITYTMYASDYRILLCSESLARQGNFSYAMGNDPPIPEPMHFCGLKCFSSWAKSLEGVHGR
jgi:hypothetical protein